MLTSFFHNMMLIITTVFVFFQLRNYILNKRPNDQNLFWLYSLVGGCLSVATMLQPFKYDGMVFDLRSVPIFLIAYLRGWKAGILVAILPSLYRFYIGGSAIAQGIIIGGVLPVVVGALFHKRMIKIENITITDLKKVSLVFLLQSFLKAFMIWYTVDLTFSVFVELNIHMTVFSWVSLICMVIMINEENRKILLQKKVTEDHIQIQSLADRLKETNNTLHTLIDVMPVGVMFTDIQGNVQVINDTALKLLEGYMPPNIFDKHSEYTFHKYDGSPISVFELPLPLSMERGEIIRDTETLINFKDGKELVVLASSTPIMNDFKEVVGGVVTFRDITERKKMEEQLRQGQEINQTILNAITETMLLTDAEHRILAVNTTGAKRLGGNAEELKGQYVLDLMKDDLRDRRLKVLETVIKTKRPIQTHDYRQGRHLNTVIYPLLDKQGEIKWLATFSQDITKLKETEKAKNQLIRELSEERKKLYEKNQQLTTITEEYVATLEVLQLKNEELHVANNIKSNFIANVSHELKTPLNIIMTYLEYLLEEHDGSLNQNQKGTMEIVYANADRLKDMIMDMLDLSTLESKSMEFNYKNINVNRLIRSIARDSMIIARNKGIGIQVALPEEDIMIATDGVKLRQVVDNLLDNAIKFSHEGEIRIELIKKEHLMEIKIKDYGIGIDEEKMQDIFKPFVQLDESLTKKYPGVGLGLSIAIKIIQQMGGNIMVHNNPDKGCLFTIQIPCNDTIEKEGAYEEDLYCG